MENTPKALPGAGAIIADSWKFFVSKWNESFKVSVMFLYVGLAYVAVAIIAHYVPSATPLIPIVSLGCAIVTAWISIQLIMALLNLEAGKPVLAPAEAGKKAWSLFWPILLIGLLVGLIVFGTTLLFVLPGIYFGISLKFSQYSLIDQDLHGRKALAASRALVKGRWWGTFWRLIAGGFVFGLLVGIIMWVIIMIASVVSPSFRMTLNGTTSTTDPLAVGVMQFIQMAVFAVIMPLLVGFEVKIYRALQRTR